MDHWVPAVEVPCPHCSAPHLFVEPPVLRSERCGKCCYWVVEAEWHESLMRLVAQRVTRALRAEIRAR